MDSGLIRRAVQGASRNIRQGKIRPYHNLKEDWYDICKDRQLKLDEIAVAVYLRGKSCRYGNPFRLANKTIYKQLHSTRRIIDKVKYRLKMKGVLKFKAGVGKDWTEYTMLDSITPKHPHVEAKPEQIKSDPLSN